MTFDDPTLFDQAGEQLLPHLQHKVTLVAFGGDFVPDNIAVACDDCNQVLIDFSPGEDTERECATSEPQHPPAIPQRLEELLVGCRLLTEQYDSVLDFQLGGNLTHRPFVIIRDALKELKAMPGSPPTANGNG